MIDNYQKAIDLFKKKDYKNAFIIFEQLNKKYECGYCKLMCANLYEAQSIWEKSRIDSPALKWGLALIKIINLNVPENLSFFQIRNFLERDLTLLIENQHNQYAENVISATDILTEYNPETPKFVGRVLLNTNNFELAFEFLLKARNICYIDPEVHFLMAQYYIKHNDKTSAKRILQTSLDLNPEYFPASNLLKQL